MHPRARSSQENSCAKKAQVRNALFPLPPTGFASHFCAKAGADEIDGLTQALCGVRSRFASCTVCKVLQSNEKTIQVSDTSQAMKGVQESPDLRGGISESMGFGDFYFRRLSP